MYQKLKIPSAFYSKKINKCIFKLLVESKKNGLNLPL